MIDAITRPTNATRRPIAVFFLITLPWLNPFSPGPMPAAVSLLFSWACVAALLAVCGGEWSRLLGERRVRVTAGAWLAAALLSAVMGLLQYFDANAALRPWVNPTALGEAYANLRQRNQFASLLNIGLMALLWWEAQGHFSRTLPGGAWRRGRFHLPPGAAVVAAVLLAAGNAASSSRTGLVQLVLVVLLALYWGGLRQPGVRRVLFATGLAFVVASFALPWLAGLDPFSNGAWARLRAGDPACASRLTLWGNVLHLIAQKPWLGWGWGELDYAHFITLYPGARFCDILDNAHNLPLHLAVELGVPAALLVCGVGLGLVWRARPWRETDLTRQLAWGVLALILVHSLLEYPLWYGPFQMAFGLSVWLLWRSPDVENNDGLSAKARPVHALIAALLISSIGYVAWDYYRVSQLYRTPAMRSEAYRVNTLEKVRDSWLFRNQLRFAELTITPLTSDNAAQMHDLAKALLSFSPEPRVIEKLIESAVRLGLEDEALFYLARYRAAFPEQHERWTARNRLR